MSEQRRKYLLDFSKPELEALLEKWGEPTYRAGQIWRWLYRHMVGTVDEMTNLPKALRWRLAEECHFTPLKTQLTMTAADRMTAKSVFALEDGARIETVLMRYDRRRTLCISTQAGCAMACPFCATGQMGFSRNLTAAEIVAQVLYFARRLMQDQERVTNVVFMGMGEPLANYTATWQAIRRLNDAGGFNLGARHLTLSTVGLVPAIRRMMREPEQVGLAVSLHAPTDELRSELVPLNRRYPLDMLLQVCRDYVAVTSRRLTFEYALMDGLNDRDEQADQLATLLAGLQCHVNLIPLNPTPNSPFSGSPDERVYAFRDRLRDHGLSTTVRLRRGIDIQAGCGQLQVLHQEATPARSHARL
jgi:23S rRNA (adenine2503-C2)-methyltransferase